MSKKAEPSEIACVKGLFQFYQSKKEKEVFSYSYLLIRYDTAWPCWTLCIRQVGREKSFILLWLFDHINHMGVYESNLIESRFRFTYKSCQVEKPKMSFFMWHCPLVIGSTKMNTFATQTYLYWKKWIKASQDRDKSQLPLCSVPPQKM